MAELTDVDLAQIRDDYAGVNEYDSVPRLLAEVDRLRAQLGAGSTCPTCSGRSRETTHMICMECGTDYLAQPPQKLTANGLAVLLGYRAELHRLRAELAAGNASDGFHTHRELYESRLLLHAHATSAWLAKGWKIAKSRRHHDGELCFDGEYFIVVAQLPTGQISFHYRNADWNLFTVPEVPLPPEWDGHSPAEAAQRLRNALLLVGEGHAEGA